jgi:hypothetical protein
MDFVFVLFLRSAEKGGFSHAYIMERTLCAVKAVRQL